MLKAASKGFCFCPESRRKILHLEVYELLKAFCKHTPTLRTQLVFGGEFPRCTQNIMQLYWGPQRKSDAVSSTASVWDESHSSFFSESLHRGLTVSMRLHGDGWGVARHRTSYGKTSEPIMNAVNHFISLNLSEGPCTRHTAKKTKNHNRSMPSRYLLLWWERTTWPAPCRARGLHLVRREESRKHHGNTVVWPKTTPSFTDSFISHACVWRGQQSDFTWQLGTGEFL